MAEKKFIPVKVTDREWAEKLLDGEVFMRPLYEFGAWNLKKEDKQLNNSFRGDLCEGMSGIFGEVEECPIYDSFDENVKKYQAIITPIDIAGERLGTLFIYKCDEQYDIDDIILSEYGTTVVGLEMMRSVNEENVEENRKVQVVKSAFNTLSFSELEAITHIFDELEGNEGILVASKIADRVGITRSVIVNALRKFESAGVIESRSSGMKGTYIKVLNDVVFDELKTIKASNSNLK